MLRNFFGRQGKTHAGRNGWLGDAHCAGRDNQELPFKLIMIAITPFGHTIWSCCVSMVDGVKEPPVGMHWKCCACLGSILLLMKLSTFHRTK